MNNVTFKYPKTKTKIIDNLSMTIKSGSHVAIVGENGAGKSTLIKLIVGLYPPISGSIELDDRSLDEYQIGSWHDQIAFLGQDFVMYEFGTIYENVTFGNVNKQPVDTEVDIAMSQAEFSGVVDKLEHGTETYVNRWMGEYSDGVGAIELSGGQKQRLALARNFYRDSPIVILDEPTSAIDALAESRIFDKLFKQKNKTIITISHRLTTVEKADTIYMMESGRVVESGTHEELVQKKGKYYKMFRSQLRK